MQRISASTKTLELARLGSENLWLGFAQEAQRIAARVLGYAQVKELVDAAPNQYAD